MKVFPCKDCDIEFPTAAKFSAHIPGCVPTVSAAKRLKEAVALLRRWARGSAFVGETRRGLSAKGHKLTEDTLDWLKFRHGA